MASLLDGPRLPPAAGGTREQLVVFLHGYGADGNDLIGLGREWARDAAACRLRLAARAGSMRHVADGPAMVQPDLPRSWRMTRGVERLGPVLEAFLACGA